MHVIGWIIAAIVAAVLILIICSELEVSLSIKRIGQNDEWTVKFRWLYGLVRRTFNIPTVRWKDYGGLNIQEQISGRDGNVEKTKAQRIDREFIMREYRRLNQIMRGTFELSRWFKETLKHVRCRELYWHTQLGAGDAADTATLTGLAWSLKGSLVGLLSNYIRLAVQPRLHITPRYNEAGFNVELSCIFSVRTGYAMVAGMLLLMRIMRTKGGMRIWRSTLFKAS